MKFGIPLVACLAGTSLAAPTPDDNTKETKLASSKSGSILSLLLGGIIGNGDALLGKSLTDDQLRSLLQSSQVGGVIENSANTVNSLPKRQETGADYMDDAPDHDSPASSIGSLTGGLTDDNTDDLPGSLLRGRNVLTGDVVKERETAFQKLPEKRQLQLLNDILTGPLLDGILELPGDGVLGVLGVRQEDGGTKASRDLPEKRQIGIVLNLLDRILERGSDGISKRDTEILGGLLGASGLDINLLNGLIDIGGDKGLLGGVGKK